MTPLASKTRQSMARAQMTPAPSSGCCPNLGILVIELLSRRGESQTHPGRATKVSRSLRYSRKSRDFPTHHRVGVETLAAEPFLDHHPKHHFDKRNSCPTPVSPDQSLDSSRCPHGTALVLPAIQQSGRESVRTLRYSDACVRPQDR